VRVHDLRHASASWALAGGASVQEVRAHLGRCSLHATDRYLHNLPGTDRAAINTLSRILEHETTPDHPTVQTPTQLTPPEAPTTRTRAATRRTERMRTRIRSRDTGTTGA
jgi:hypothetical protein